MLLQTVCLVQRASGTLFMNFKNPWHKLEIEIPLFYSRVFEVHLLKEFRSLLYYCVSSPVSGMSSPSRNLVSSSPDNNNKNLWVSRTTGSQVYLILIARGKGDPDPELDNNYSTGWYTRIGMKNKMIWESGIFNNLLVTVSYFSVNNS